jgi:hypothetical protein
MNTTFSLRKLELAFPYLEAAQKNDPTALVSLAAIAMADESSCKLIAAGNVEVLNTWKDKVYESSPDEVAALLQDFIKGSKRFTLIISGLTPEQVNQKMSQDSTKLLELLGE